ncbi:unnamed protein product [Didymodactylos carnosus]|uniref:Uncharacterized protein n=1 Tax=Didymodactylos carnosus TaxID=1234261 RepID=A0A814X6L7_9BILA|nr:unnamed protein product [Didymodactylos carnosus]CAF1210075.1 unnamed protein product [Didymodactylos carnosus]CAF3797898.1 unnamed protein product [Didymodactylos carnosus]CAF3974111.1 unnamed protein product [Didymodactylos carnosus]
MNCCGLCKSKAVKNPQKINNLSRDKLAMIEDWIDQNEGPFNQEKLYQQPPEAPVKISNNDEIEQAKKDATKTSNPHGSPSDVLLNRERTVLLKVAPRRQIDLYTNPILSEESKSYAISEASHSTI